MIQPIEARLPTAKFISIVDRDYAEISARVALPGHMIFDHDLKVVSISSRVELKAVREGMGPIWAVFWEDEHSAVWCVRLSVDALWVAAGQVVTIEKGSQFS